jgi:hypothetical protein
LAPGVTGKIQVGADPGDSAQVSVPACGVPLAAGTDPNAPVVVVTEPLGAALEQAARPMAAATAPTASSVTGRETYRRAALREARVPGSDSGAWAAYARVIWLPSFVTMSRNSPRGTAYGLAARWRELIEQPYKVRRENYHKLLSMCR